jgi:predicted Rossmann fold flavoprotein
VLNASRHWLRAQLERRDVELTANFCPGQSFEEVDRLWTARAAANPKSSVQSTLATMTPAAFADLILRRAGIDGTRPLAHFARAERRQLVSKLIEWPLAVTGSRGYTHAEVTAGGVALPEIDPRTMESRVVPGLYLVGEMLDVDGRIGGFNFQWAWSTARVAGRALARR